MGPNENLFFFLNHIFSHASFFNCIRYFYLYETSCKRQFLIFLVTLPESTKYIVFIYLFIYLFLHMIFFFLELILILCFSLVRKLVFSLSVGIGSPRCDYPQFPAFANVCVSQASAREREREREKREVTNHGEGGERYEHAQTGREASNKGEGSGRILEENQRDLCQFGSRSGLRNQVFFLSLSIFLIFFLFPFFRYLSSCIHNRV